jgi:two-component system nitrogen regulation sensor histidine kinase NtrY
VKPRIRHIFLSQYSFLFIAAVLFALSIIFSKLYTTKSSISQDTRELEKYLEKQQRDFDEFITDTSFLRELVQKKETLKEFNRLAGKRYGIFLYAANDVGGVYMKFWSDQLVMPPQALFAAADGEYFYYLSNGYYIGQKRTLSLNGIDEKILAIAMIPVRSKFFIQTAYLPHEFVHSKAAEKRVYITEGVATEFPVRSVSGKTLFYLDKKQGGAIPYNDRLTIFLRLAGVAFLFLFLHLLAEILARRYGPWTGITVLSIVVITLRIATYYLPSLLNLRQFELFDPAIYGSNAVQRSLGDLLLNAALFCWIVLFAWSRLHHLKHPTSHFSPVAKWTAGILSLCLLIYSTFLSSAVIRSIVADSKISFDVTNFASLTRYSVFGFLVLAILILSYYYFTQLLFRLMFPLFEGRTVIIYFVIGFAGLTFLTLRSGDPDVLFFLPVLLWLLGYTWLVNREGLLFNRLRVNISGILFWIFVFSISISAIMLIENSKAEWEKRKSLAYKQAKQLDSSNENLLSIALSYLDNDFLQGNYARFADPLLSKKIRDSILTDQFAGYLDKYDTRLYLYDSLNRGINNDDATSYDDLNTLLTVQAQQTQTEGIYYYETSFEKFIYITRRNFEDTNARKMGSLFIISNPRNFSNEALFPELFKQLRQNDLESSPIYSYAVYQDRQLKSPSNKYPFPIWIENAQVPKEEFEKRANGEYDELWYRASNDKVVVITRKRDTLIETITLFSYIFCSLLFLVFIVQFISFILKVLNNRTSVRKLLQLSIRTQVHSTIIFISIFSFLIIGVSTISFFIGRYERSNTDKLSRTMKIMVNEMQKEQANHSMFDDVVKIYDTVVNSRLQKLVEEVSDIHGVDVNVYDLNGDLKVSSEKNVYTKGVLSRKMDPTAYYYLDRYRQVKHSQVEKIGNFSYLSIYAPVRDADGNAQAYINIPYFTSTPELNQEISNFLVTLINLNAFIFLVAGLIALFITNRITRSFSVISDKMREVNLGKLNEEIAWNREDEIGELVKEYNKMVTKLGESAAALAKSEREGAWREMARQVAHEIKNPLTPMKLSIQYLQKAIDNNQPNVKELSANVANTLVEQIDHLSKIAADFSQFANIGNTNVTRFDLHDVLASLRDLYRADERVNFEWYPSGNDAVVEADKTQMNRLFTNLFANAVEACNGSSACLIEVKEKQSEGHILISVKDNGEGIPEEMRSRIFVPNFTTKSSGTGLGLAMCKGIVEQARGKIWFETEVGQGTVFYVELPLAEER